jgi:hypothetical protein
MRKEAEPQGPMAGLFEAMPKDGDKLLAGLLGVLFDSAGLDEEVEDI